MITKISILGCMLKSEDQRFGVWSFVLAKVVGIIAISHRADKSGRTPGLKYWSQRSLGGLGSRMYVGDTVQNQTNNRSEAVFTLLGAR